MSETRWNFSLVLSILATPMKPAGQATWVQSLPSILINCCTQILFTSSPVKVLESAPPENDERETFSQLVGTGRWPRSKHTSQFTQHPTLWGCHMLHTLLGTTRLHSVWEQLVFAISADGTTSVLIGHPSCRILGILGDASLTTTPISLHPLNQPRPTHSHGA